VTRDGKPTQGGERMDKQGGVDLLPKNKKKTGKKNLPIDVGVAILPY